MIETLTPTEYVQSLCYTTPEGPVQPLYHPPTEQFLEELVSPEIVTAGGLSHAVYTFNRDKLGDSDRPPVVANLSYGIPVLGRYGATLMNALATQLDRPVIGIDYPGVGLSSAVRWSELPVMSLPLAANARVKALEVLGHDAVDVLGICLGGVVAMHMAVGLGEKARSVQTHATPGFERSFIGLTLWSEMDEMYDARTEDYHLMALIDDEYTTDDFDHLKRAPTPIRGVEMKVRRAATEIRLGAAIGLGRSNIPALVNELHPNTHWRDVLGGHDSLTNLHNHTRSIEARNRRFPGSSELTAIKDIDHEWSRERIVLTARDVELFSQKITDQAAA